MAMTANPNYTSRRPSNLDPSPPTTPRFDIDPHTIDHAAILSAEEIQVLRHRFASYNSHASRQTKSLSRPQAIKLFRDDYPGLSEWEIQDMFHKCDLNFDGNLSIAEYLQARAYHRLLLEANTENEVFRSSTILDTDSDGIILADDVLALVEQSGLRTVGVLKQAILQAAAATNQADAQLHRHHQYHHHQTPRRHHDGEITFEHFAHTIRMVNRKMEQEIATKSLRVMSLQAKLAQTNHHLLGANLWPAQRRAKEKQEVLHIEIDVLQKEILRAKRELLTDANNPLGKICENLVATYENEQYVYECLSNFITYSNLHNATLFRYKLEKSGKEVHVLDSLLLSPPPHLKKTEGYARMMDLSLTSYSVLKSPATASSGTTTTNHDVSSLPPGDHLSISSPLASRTATDELLVVNSTLRKQFVHYTMAANVTNLETMTRSGFTKFVRDCELDTLPSPPLTEADLVNVFAKACGTSKSMRFHQWIAACQLLLQRAFPLQSVTGDTLEALVKKYVMLKAKCIQTQNLAPDVSLSHVMKLLKEHIWQFKQIFSHFGIQSLVEELIVFLDKVDSKVTVDMKEFLSFARAFANLIRQWSGYADIIRATAERDGEPFTPPPMSESTVIQPISLMELMREFYAAKLDVSFANPARRDAPDLNFREFLRCILRISLAMHAHNPKKQDKNRSNGISTTSFEALKEEEGRLVQRAHTSLYHRRHNLLGSSPMKTCKMTSTSIISKLLRTSRAVISQRDDTDSHTAPSSPRCTDLALHTHLDPLLVQAASSPSNSPIKIVYGQKSPDNRKQGFAIDSHKAQFSPVRPGAPQRARPRPVTSGGPPIVRLIRPPPDA